MSDLKEKLNEIMNDFDKNIKNKEDLEYIKSQVYNISALFLDEMDKLAEINLQRLNVLNDREKELAKRVADVEKAMDMIKKEMFVEPEECDFEIVCPYCNEVFVEDFTDGIKNEIKCPECDNVIELDWHEEDECGCGCEHDCDCGCGDDCDCEDCDCDDDCECDGECNCNHCEDNEDDM